MTISLPQGARYLIHKLEQTSEAYVVGGCVRDALRGVSPNDWDLCTSATPRQMLDILQGEKVLETGLKHGTVTVLLPDGAYEVTTYRVDGVYSDGRHPDQVTFTCQIADDLARRDFTMNAMAYHPSRGLVDPFGGLQDLQDGLIQAVGDADKRFEEDSLRILRALRFASTLGFHLSEACNGSVHRNRRLLDRVSKERIQVELSKLLLGDGVKDILMEYPDVLSQIIPSIEPMVEFSNNSTPHCFTPWEHTAHTVACAPKDPIVRWTMLLHNMGTFTTKSAKIAQEVLEDLHMDRHTIQKVVQLLEEHDSSLPQTDKAVKRWLNQLGEEQFRRLLQVHRADTSAFAPDYRQKKLGEIEKSVSCMEKVLKEGQCFSIRNLAVDGRDILDVGIPAGPEVGRILQHLLDLVMDQVLDNDRECLLKEVENLVKGG